MLQDALLRWEIKSGDLMEVERSNIGALGNSIDLRSMNSSKLKSSTYFFFRIFSSWWQRGRGQACAGAGSGPSTPSASERGMGQGAPAKLACRSNSRTVRSPPWGPPPGMSCSEDVAPDRSPDCLSAVFQSYTQHYSC